jgi:hypothetical protein
MKLTIFAAGLLSLAIAAPVSAQSVPDDMRCFVLSNFFAKSDKDPKRRMLAAESTIFYLGRLDGRADSRAIVSGLHSQIDPKSAGPLMTACAQHLGRAEQTMQEAIRSQVPAAKH